jgi:hypothetical protein
MYSPVHCFFREVISMYETFAFYIQIASEKTTRGIRDGHCRNHSRQSRQPLVDPSILGTHLRTLWHTF